MPATIPHICPHCGHDNIVFTVRAEIPWEKEKRHATDNQLLFQTLVTCGSCGMAAVAVLKRPDTATPTPFNYPGQYNIAAGSLQKLELVDFFPKPELKEPPRHLPDDVDKAMRQAYALEIRKAKGQEMFEPTVIMARKAVERAIGHIAPDLSGPLGNRLKALRKRGDIPQALLDWADEVKALGNIGAHDTETTEEDARQAVSFAEMFLTYMFTLPEEIRRRRKSV
ncbi:DUF4145 domain-containing protein [Candidatus Parcubacteria bacterium]|nr:MAG: DUF4145 domain-containing protein [Candidatus Parcubacteria bacterium]